MEGALFMIVQEPKLKKFMLDSGLVSRTEVAAAEKEAEKGGGSVGDILVTQGKISPDDLRRVQAYILGIPFLGRTTTWVLKEEKSKPVAAPNLVQTNSVN